MRKGEKTPRYLIVESGLIVWTYEMGRLMAKMPYFMTREEAVKVRKELGTRRNNLKLVRVA